MKGVLCLETNIVYHIQCGTVSTEKVFVYYYFLGCRVIISDNIRDSKNLVSINNF